MIIHVGRLGNSLANDAACRFFIITYNHVGETTLLVPKIYLWSAFFFFFLIQNRILL